MAYTKDTYKGRYTPKNPHKYRGDVTHIIYRSSYEVRFMKWCDFNEGVIEWGSEEIVVPYLSPLDNKIHRYFVDFFIKVKTKDGVIKKYLIEVKPFRFTQEPHVPSRKTKTFINEVFQWAVNNAKWDAARNAATQYGWEFMLITEKDLGLLQNRDK
jgi:hypothetical protein